MELDSNKPWAEVMRQLRTGSPVSLRVRPPPQTWVPARLKTWTLELAYAVAQCNTLRVVEIVVADGFPYYAVVLEAVIGLCGRAPLTYLSLENVLIPPQFMARVLGALTRCRTLSTLRLIRTQAGLQGLIVLLAQMIKLAAPPGAKPLAGDLELGHPDTTLFSEASPQTPWLCPIFCWGSRKRSNNKSRTSSSSRSTSTAASSARRPSHLRSLILVDPPKPDSRTQAELCVKMLMENEVSAGLGLRSLHTTCFPPGSGDLVARVLGRDSSLRVLVLQGCELQQDDIQSIAVSLWSNPPLQRLVLDPSQCVMFHSIDSHYHLANHHLTFAGCPPGCAACSWSHATSRTMLSRNKTQSYVNALAEYIIHTRALTFPPGLVGTIASFAVELPPDRT